MIYCFVAVFCADMPDLVDNGTTLLDIVQQITNVRTLVIHGHRIFLLHYIPEDFSRWPSQILDERANQKVIQAIREWNEQFRIQKENLRNLDIIVDDLERNVEKIKSRTLLRK
jgi:hypothetical protein